MTSPYGEKWYRLPSDSDPPPGWTKWLLVAIAVATFALTFLLLDGCHHEPAPTPPIPPIPPIRLVRTWTSCLETPPPAAPAFAPLPGDDPRCPAPLSCFDRTDAIALVQYIDRLEVWSRAAWARCSQVALP